jgi:hypothetical protein
MQNLAQNFQRPLGARLRAAITDTGLSLGASPRSSPDLAEPIALPIGQTTGAHSFNVMIGGASYGDAYMACQLYNSSGVDTPDHEIVETKNVLLHHSWQRFLCATVAIACVVAGYVAVVAHGDDQPQSTGAKYLPKVAAEASQSDGKPAPYAFARAAAVGPADAKPVFTTATGETVSIAHGDGVSCLLYSGGADSCHSADEIARGWSFRISNDCSSTSTSHPLSMSGMVPSNVAGVRLTYDDKTQQTGEVRDGVFLFDGETPAANDPSPVTIQWLGDDGAVVAEHPFPLAGNQFCPGS